VHDRLPRLIFDIINSLEYSTHNGAFCAKQLALLLEREALYNPINNERHIPVARPQSRFNLLSLFG
jgi:hypothetical protein